MGCRNAYSLRKAREGTAFALLAIVLPTRSKLACRRSLLLSLSVYSACVSANLSSSRELDASVNTDSGAETDADMAPNGDGSLPADGDATARADADEATEYALCDGSDEVRFGMTVEGGSVEPTYPFSNPHGHRFMYITGRCELFAAPASAQLGTYRHGTLTPTQAAQLVDSLKLSSLSGLSYQDVESCPDAGGTKLVIAGGYADCTCGCDDGAPAPVLEAFAALQTALQAVLVDTQPLAGPVAMLVEKLEGALPASARAWPFAFEAASVAVTQEQIFSYWDGDFPSIELTGEAATTARELRAKALAANPYQGSIPVSDAGQGYYLYLRDVLPPAIETAIRAFHAANEPRR